MAETKAIRKRLIDMELTMADLAREYGCTRQTVSMVVKGITKSAPLQAFIECKLKARRGELFPREIPGKAA